MTQIIGVVSLKGGVGKTSVVSALGEAIADFDKKVLLVDGNLSAPNLGIHFNVINPQTTLHHVLARQARPKDAIHELENLDLMPASHAFRLPISPLKLKDRIGYLKRSYDHIILDSSPSLNEETLGVMLASDGILVVTTPDYPTLTNTLKAVELAKYRGAPIMGLIVNKVYDKDFEISLKDIEDTIEVPVMAVIPHDTNFLDSVANFKSIRSFKPKSKGSEEFNKLASVLIGEKYKSPKFKKFFRWVNPKKQDINRALYYDRVFR